MSETEEQAVTATYPCAPAPPVEIKLFVAHIPKTYEEAEIRKMFDEYGEVKDVVVIRDRATNAHKSCAFVRMVSISQADAAIKNLNNNCVVDTASGPVVVKYAAGEAERLGFTSMVGEPGANEAKLFVGSIPKTADDAFVREIFQPFGTIDDVFVMKDQNGVGKGCAFVKMAYKEQGLYAIRSLSGMKQLEGCSRPMEVRFAESKAKTQHNPVMQQPMPMRAPIVQPPYPMPTPSQVRQVGIWREYISPEGKPYFYNEQTGQTQWERPPEFDNPTGTTQVPSGPPGANLFIFHIPNEWTQADLVSTFAQFGKILSSRIASDKMTGRHKGYAFVSYDSPESAAQAIQQLNGYMVLGKRLKVAIKKGEESAMAAVGSVPAMAGGAPVVPTRMATPAYQTYQQQPAAGSQHYPQQPYYGSYQSDVVPVVLVVRAQFDRDGVKEAHPAAGGQRDALRLRVELGDLDGDGGLDAELVGQHAYPLVVGADHSRGGGGAALREGTRAYLLVEAGVHGLDVERGGEQAVDDDVGVATDGGGEVSVELAAKPVVPEVGHAVVARAAVNGLTHATRGEDADGAADARVAAVDDAPQGGVEVAGVAELEVELVLRQGALQGLEALLDGRRVATEKGAGGKALEYFGGHADVGQQHELLDHAVRVVENVLLHLADVSQVVLELDVGRLELDGAALEALGAEQLGEAVQTLERLGRFITGWAERAPAANDALAEAGAADGVVLVKLPDHGKTEPVLVGDEGAEVGGQQGGKHVRATVHQVDGGAALGGLAVQPAAGADEVRHVRNVDRDFDAAVLQGAEPEGVVDVLAAGRVDGEDELAAEVHPAGYFSLAGLPVRRGQFLVGAGGEVAGDDLVLAEDHGALRLHVLDVADDLHPVAARFAREAVPGVDGDDDALALQFTRLARVDENEGDPRVDGDEHALDSEVTSSDVDGVVDRHQAATVLAPVAFHNAHDAALLLDALSRLLVLCVVEQLDVLRLFAHNLLGRDCARGCLWRCICRGLTSLDYLDADAVSVDGAVQVVAAGDFVLLFATRDVAVLEGAHVHVQDAAVVAATFDALLHLGLREVHGV
ncbi:CUGBP Elav-like family member 1 [Babesia caballi]|uniref:CUGBP Elav-like family member 1 n=1 Tax=Babesia caballi TaxID=5871 RepID=A0AAV4LUW3_BABCB|nr:CUGBP Elav-like family member 1 [Babesia caballi]